MSDELIDDAEQIRNRYLREVASRLKILPADERREVVRELDAHLQDAANASGACSPAQMRQAIADLGDPDQFLPEWVDAIRTEQGAARGSPIRVLRLMVANAGRGLLDAVIVMVAGLVMLGCVLTVLVALISLFDSGAGFYWGGWSNFSLSFEAQTGTERVSNALFVPLGILLSVVVFMLLSRLLARRARHHRSVRRGS